jgi:hypothetical protein
MFWLILTITIAVFCYWRGRAHGLNDGIKVARDWRMLLEIELADTQTEEQAIKERRELERMYDGV